MRTRDRLVVLGLVMALSIAVDQATKQIATATLKSEPARSYLGDLFRLQYSENPGAFLSLGAGLPDDTRAALFMGGVGVLLAGMLAFAILFRRLRPMALVALALFLGGGFSNWFDRLAYGNVVVDFMNAGIGPVRTGIFNVADLFVVGGAVLLFISEWLAGRAESAHGTRESKPVTLEPAGNQGMGEQSTWGAADWKDPSAFEKVYLSGEGAWDRPQDDDAPNGLRPHTLERTHANMAPKTLPLTREQIAHIAERYPTPFHIYDEKAIRENARRLKQAFEGVEGFKEYFAVKALPNPFIMKILSEEGFGADCSSLPELLLSERAGIVGEDIMFTSNDTPEGEFVKAKALGAVINLDDISHISFLEQAAGMPELICLRYNPGPLKQGNAIIGKPEEAKYGFTREQLFEGYRMAMESGAKRFGLHTMVASNELDYKYFIETAALLFDLVVEINRELGIRIEFVNIGGGIGIPYRPEQEPVSFEKVARGVREAYHETIVANGLAPVKLFMECGRVITGPYGYLVTTVRHLKHTYKDYVGLDACMANLMRPAMYGAYHHITVVGKESLPLDRKYDVTGSLCENNDKFAVDRMLPEVEPGDTLVIHDTGAHGHAMGFQYNGKLRSAELLLRESGEVVLIRRAETPEDYFNTLDFAALEDFR